MTPYYRNLLESSPSGSLLQKTVCGIPRRNTGEKDDYLGETQFEAVPGLIHRYPDRALILTTGRCALYCSHCNRRRIWNTGRRSKEEFREMADYCKKHPEIREVILSGGDPLTMPESYLLETVSLFKSISSVKLIRIGSRMPVVDPAAVTEALCHRLSDMLPIWFLTQFNHSEEVTEEAEAACRRLQKAGIPVLNQSVLLKGINNSEEVLYSLFTRLAECGVKPYYLFHCEPAAGTRHFISDKYEGLEIMNRLKKRLGGFSVPAYIEDTPEKGKVPVEKLCE
ncbi:MAG: KamA family radical SAM protein [Fibrobacterota bacterium]